MQDFVGNKLSDVINKLQSLGKKYEIISNNHNVNGDTILVTNIKTKDDVVYVTTGEFIFNIKGDEEDNA